MIVVLSLITTSLTSRDMTPAINILKKAGVTFKIHEYQHEAGASSYGEEAAQLLGVDVQRVFKTLLIEIQPNKLAVAIIPVSHTLNLKSVAKALKTKKVKMANPADAEKATGYILGGISPLGQKKRLPFVIDISINDLETVYVSGGRRGLEIELAPNDLTRLCHAILTNIIAE